MDYKLLALDLDGTLLRPDGGIDDVDLAAIARLRDAGVPVTIATGRMFSGSVAAAQRAGIMGPIACCDGSHIVEVRGRRELVHEGIAGDDALALKRVVERHQGNACFLLAQDSIVHDDRGAPFVPYVRTWSTELAAVAHLCAHPHWEHEQGVLGVIAVGAASDIDEMATELTVEVGHAARTVSFALSRQEGMAALVTRAKGPTKGTAVGWLAEHHGCAPVEVVVVGDWFNDLPMFEVAGRSFAMAQAPERVKSVASDVLEADRVRGGGVAEAIAKAWGI